VVFVTDEAGIGKTTLTHQFLWESLGAILAIDAEIAVAGEQWASRILFRHSYQASIRQRHGHIRNGPKVNHTLFWVSIDIRSVGRYGMWTRNVVSTSLETDSRTPELSALEERHII
jgi:hypothetical protein